MRQSNFLHRVIFRPKAVFCCAKQMTDFYMKRNTGLRWVNVIKHPFTKRST